MRYWRDKRLGFLLHTELRKKIIIVTIMELFLLAIGLFGRWLMMMAVLAAIVIIEVLTVELVRVSHNLHEERVAKDLEREETESVFRDIRAQRHDFLAHAGAIHYMLEEGQASEASAYLNHLLNEYDRVNSGLRGEKAHTAALLLHTAQQCKSANVRLILDLVVPLSELPMSAVDQSKLVSNILSNAFEAAEASGIVDAHVKMTSLVGGGLYVLEIDNSTPPLLASQADRLFQRFGTSTKNGSHRGIGTYIISSLVESYNGHLEFSTVKNRFSLKIKLPIVK